MQLDVQQELQVARLIAAEAGGQGRDPARLRGGRGGHGSPAAFATTFSAAQVQASQVESAGILALAALRGGSVAGAFVAARVVEHGGEVVVQLDGLAGALRIGGFRRVFAFAAEVEVVQVVGQALEIVVQVFGHRGLSGLGRWPQHGPSVAGVVRPMGPS